MPLIPREFYSHVSSLSRLKKLVIPIGVFFVLALVGAGFYFFSQKKDDKGAVASAQNAQALPREWVAKYFLTDDENAEHVGGPDGDPDGDILTNYQEYLYGTDPTKDDTDDDGQIDSYEVAFGANPLGEGDMVLTSDADSYVRDIIASDEEYKNFSQEKVIEEAMRLFQPGGVLVFDFPKDSELIITNNNDIPSLEKYFQETQSLIAANELSIGNLNAEILESISPEQLNSVIIQIQVTLDLLKKVPAPSETKNIHKLKIAGFRAGLKMFELVRDKYQPGNIAPDFWSEFFNYATAAETAERVELAAWQELGQKLKDTGGL